MDEKTDHALLIGEIRTLELAIANSGGPAVVVSDNELQQMSLNDLRNLRDRLQRLVRSLGGIRNG
jgi:ABC-type branched-subunit amino acid transport system ATPase component